MIHPECEYTTMHEFRSVAALSGWLADAQQLPADAFAARTFEWLQGQIRCDRGAIISSHPQRPTYFDAHYFGFPDVAATLASWQRVAHLDVVSPQTLANPGRARRQDVDMAEIAGSEFAPLREHLENHGITHTIAIALQVAPDPHVTLMLLIRSHPGDRFDDAALAELETSATVACQLLNINRTQHLIRSGALGDTDLPVALMNDQGSIIVSTPAFARILWQDRSPQTSYLEEDCIAALKKSRSWQLPGGEHSMHATRDIDGWLLRLRPASRLDRLSRREREVAGLYANGEPYTQIAELLNLAPATVRNHVSKIYQKLEVSHRADLIRALAPEQQTSESRAG